MDTSSLNPLDALGSLVIIIASVILYIQNKKQTIKVHKVQRTVEDDSTNEVVKEALERLDKKIDSRFDSLEREINSLHQEDSFIRRLLDAHIQEADRLVRVLQDKGIL